MPVRTARALALKDSREAIRRSRELSALHRRLAARCESSVTTALEHCAVSFGFAQGSLPAAFRCTFYLRALVEDEPRLAIWRERALLVHPTLADRAALVVGLGETFKTPEYEYQVIAGLDQPLQAALTLMRAADQVLEFQFKLGELEFSYHSNESRSGVVQ